MRCKYKIVFLGSQNVGKTTLISQFVYGSIEEKYQPTIGIDFLTKKLEIEDKEVKLQIWDTAGQEKFNSIISSYARDSFIAVVVYDITDFKSFEAVDSAIINLVRKHDPHNKIKVLLVANKTDLLTNDSVCFKGEEKAVKFGCAYIETSAKSKECIKELKEYFELEIKNDLEEETEKEKVKPNLENKKKCC